MAAAARCRLATVTKRIRFRRADCARGVNGKLPLAQFIGEEIARLGPLDPALALPQSWFARPAMEVAHDLVGAVFVSWIEGELVAGILVEVEAYGGPEDPASHAARLR